VLASGRLVLGPEVEAFEAEFAASCGTAHCVSVGSGYDALRLTLRALDVGPGDEVIVPSHTFVATWLAVLDVGARPVPVEPDPASFDLNPDLVAAAVGPRTRAIVPVHLYGRPADVTRIGAVARRHGLAVVEDAAQAHGARHAGRPVGSLGQAGCFSFYPVKNLGALGDGGAVTTDDAGLAFRLRRLRSYGASERGRHEVAAGHSRLDELQAAFLRVLLARLPARNARRRALARRYRDAFAGLADPVAPTAPIGDDHAWHLFVVRSRARDALRGALAAAGVETLVHYPTPPHLTPALAGLGWARGSLPCAERLAREVLSLPLHPALADAEVDRVAAAVIRAARGGSFEAPPSRRDARRAYTVRE